MKIIYQLPIFLLFLACTDQQKSAKVKDNQAPIAKHVVVIGVDGLSPDGIRNAETPHIDSLVSNGASTMMARAILPTSSSSNWASMIMGAGPEQHGITSNKWERDKHTLPPVSTGLEDIFPTVFGILHQQQPAAEIGVIYHWGDFGRLYEKSAVDYDINGETEEKTTELAATYIKLKKPTLCFIHLDHVDHAGHHDGHGSQSYYQSVAKADTLIGKVVAAVNEAGINEETVIILSADHGGIGYGHGGETPAEINIPFVISGKGIQKGKPINHEVFTYDNAATVAFILGLETPYAWIGRPIKSAFQGYENPITNFEN